MANGEQHTVAAIVPFATFFALRISFILIALLRCCRVWPACAVERTVYGFTADLEKFFHSIRNIPAARRVCVCAWISFNLCALFRLLLAHLSQAHQLAFSIHCSPGRDTLEYDKQFERTHNRCSLDFCANLTYFLISCQA